MFMASLDFVYDLTDRFEEDNIEYVVVALREGKALDKVDVFYKTKPESKASMLTALEQLSKLIKEDDGDGSDGKKKKRRRKK